jgi:hypothetical protein
MGAGLLSALGGAMQNIGQMGYQNAMKEEAEQRAETRAIAAEGRAWTRDLEKIKLSAAQALETKRGELKITDDHRKATAAETLALARGIEGKELDAGAEAIEGSVDAKGRPVYSDEQKAKLKGLINSQREAAPTLENQAEARVQQGLTKPEDLQRERNVERNRVEDNLRADRKQESDEKYRNRQLDIQGAQIALTKQSTKLLIDEKLEKAADKKAAKEEFDLLASYIESAATSGKPDEFRPQINRSIVKLRSLGIDATDMVYGKLKDTGSVETKTMDASGNEVTVKQATQGRSGGVVQTAAPKRPVTGGTLVYDQKTGKMIPK